MPYPTRVLGHAGAEVRKVIRAESHAHGRLRDHVVVIFLLTVGVDLVCAVLAYLLEHDEPGSQIHTYGSALFWTSTQLLTVSSQLVNPLSTGGRILNVFMEAWAVTVIASLAAAFGAFLVKRT